VIKDFAPRKSLRKDKKIIMSITKTIKGKAFCEAKHSIRKAYRGLEGKAPVILNLDDIQSQVDSFSLRLLYL
jgi:hypothetical protein